MVAPDTRQNIYYLIVSLLRHNFFAFVYFAGIIGSLFIAFRKPSRTALLMLIGFAILLFSFEYNKHIVEPLKEQTLNSLITERQSYRIARIVSVFLGKLLPLILPLIGWAMVIIGGYAETKKILKTSHKT
ncbi:hypothetical protein A3F03_04285 [Candidatus Roizmanbacteria bacterium RIFCSPHIGHO2_12_FULL_41_11]|uniref:Uncharacterized protein n=3 Tax=Candidatus Roizmaniibacteriota TaxID=1752723 RepID=A0A1F7JS63_9BACT|nr:MAG: hypothetical protein A3F03_04285 [Candidatus Roizmanbacteria bacterium RIFCSPHIGHO2_12_FULL_41_11]OGK52800.1 MAG: hypothetical protein A2966_04825 [Candidatus Roizmanbacteria bacterium RIFCSPLOWO2_01_FULL_41_22]OGK58421.1 MAG: hypothetical protein A3H86_03585 [Candidatus Roizmanbacteria bacterium RIFCSPLOWO2_02_FULL_41_9]